MFEVDNEDNARQYPPLGQNKRNGKDKGPFDNGQTFLVQTTLSALFKKVEDKVMSAVFSH